MTSFRKAILAITISAIHVNNAAAFVPNSSQIKTKAIGVKETDLASTASPNEEEKISFLDAFSKYGEDSRAFRRTVYTHDDWVRHRSPDRFFRNLSSVFSSGIYKSLFKEVVATTTAASFVVVWNMMFGDYTDLLGGAHEGLLHDSTIPVLSLPLSVFTLSSPSLGLLLGKIQMQYSIVIQFPFILIFVTSQLTSLALLV